MTRTRVLCLCLFSAAALVAMAGNAKANNVLWDNGPVGGDTYRCDFISSRDCGGGIGWTVYDDFTVPNASVTGFTYNDYFIIGSTYSGTNWSIWASDPFTAGGPIASGTTLGVESAGDFGSTLFTITGLNVNLPAGTYWLGIENILGDDTVTLRASADGDGLPGFKQGDLLGDYKLDLEGNTAFTVEGNTSSIPEPSSFLLIAPALVGLGWLRRRAAR